MTTDDIDLPLVIIREKPGTQVKACHLRTVPWMTNPLYGFPANTTLCGRRLDSISGDDYTPSDRTT